MGCCMTAMACSNQNFVWEQVAVLENLSSRLLRDIGNQLVPPKLGRDDRPQMLRNATSGSIIFSRSGSVFFSVEGSAYHKRLKGSPNVEAFYDCLKEVIGSSEFTKNQGVSCKKIPIKWAKLLKKSTVYQYISISV